MHVKLKVLRGASTGKEIVVRGSKFFIGRAEECHLRANSDAISRRHCAITASGDEIAIRDLGSRNGTLVNGEKIAGVRPLEVGDQLRIGPLEFLVTYVREPAPKASVSANEPSEDDEMMGLIGDWLSEDGGTSVTQPMDVETREYRFDETDQIEPPKPEPEPEPEENPKKTPNVRPTPLRNNSRQAPKDTQEAAAQTLRKFFNRGGS